MNIAFIHYHLCKGGVTNVIKNQIEMLLSDQAKKLVDRVFVFYGGRNDEEWRQFETEFSTRGLVATKLPGLDYSDLQKVHVTGEETCSQIRKVIQRAGALPENTVLHFHNHSLLRNFEMANLIQACQAARYGMLLQIHDFVEEFRTSNVARFRQTTNFQKSFLDASQFLYPLNEGVHYATLNSRDQSVLKKAGVAQENLFLLANGFDAKPRETDRFQARNRLSEKYGVQPDQTYVLYPTRSLKRKNLGEVLLLSTLFPNHVFGVTLAPQSKSELFQYQCWKNLAKDLGLRVIFEIGEDGGLSLAENYAAADLVLTTSVQEGFGMAFLEPWLYGRKVIGRKLKYITRDFEKAGINFQGSYERLPVPTNWFSLSAAYIEWRNAVLASMKLYAFRPPHEPRLREAFDAKIRDQQIDFGEISPNIQAEIVKLVNTSPSHRRELLEAQSSLCESFEDRSAHDQLIQQNAQIIQEKYSAQIIANRLVNIYRSCISKRPAGQTQKTPIGFRVAKEFLQPHKMRLICQ